jgi:hypothetical protein
MLLASEAASEVGAARLVEGLRREARAAAPMPVAVRPKK